MDSPPAPSITTEIVTTEAAPPPPGPAEPAKINWGALGFGDDEMERFAGFISENLPLVLDAAQGTNLRLLSSLNARVKLLEQEIAEEQKREKRDDRKIEKMARDYRETVALALKAANQVTTSGYTRVKAAAKAVDAATKVKRRPGFVKRAEKV